MTRIDFLPRAMGDFDRIFEHYAQYNPADASARIAEIVRDIDVLSHNPTIGRQVPGGKRELVIGRKSRGYVALYRYMSNINTVFVISVRSQRQSGYSRPL